MLWQWSQCFEVRCVFWPRAGYSDEYRSWVCDCAAATNWGAVYDVEGQAKGATTRLRLALQLDRIVSNHDILTTHPGHPEATAKAVVMLSSVPEIQALSTTSNVKRATYKLAGPGNLQRRARKRIDARSKTKPWMTLPLYGQSGFAGHPHESLETAFRAAIESDIEGISLWSAKHLIRNEYAQTFLRDRLPEIIASYEDQD